MKFLDGAYNFKEAEKKWQNIWEEKQIYKWDESQNRENNFVIDTPPPTVSGQLHMGHIFSYTQTDFIARFQRMRGKNVFYPIGFDDNGLPTERLVEKQKKIRAVNLEREEFIEICKEIVDIEEEKFRELFTSISLSVDWNLKYQTISENSCHISQLSFLDLARKGEIYRAEQPILWDPVDGTALAQADVEDKEKEGEMHDIIFRGEDGEELIIATTRPELLPACVSMFFHPDDERYKHLKGKYALSPLFNQKIPIIPDDKVDPEKGTGLVMCCTFGDTTDIYWWQKHKLPLRIILDKMGKLIDFSRNSTSAGDLCVDSVLESSYTFEYTPDLRSESPSNPLEEASCERSLIEDVRFEGNEGAKIYEQLAGLKVKAAREKIVELLKEAGLLVKSVAVTQTVKCAERSGAPLEIITTPQWFVKTIEHKDDLLKRSEEINWYPKTMKVKLDNWINSISWDWCISRQRFFGVPFPVWYSKKSGEEGKILFAKPDQLPINPLVDLPEGYNREEVEADMDVMDTWATSAVSPQLSSMAINKDFVIDREKHKKLFPFDLRPQAHEILRTWAFYTILKSHLHENMLPWKNIMVSGWCLAEDKTKMSKSKGNIVSPINLIENYGADVIRYWASSSRLGADTAFSEILLKDGKRLVNKLWNASKFASSHFSKIEIPPTSLSELVESKQIFHKTDLWLISSCQKMLEEVTNSLEKFEYALAIERIEQFFWKDFCDNYLEISKTRCYDEKADYPEGQKSAILTLYHILQILLKIFSVYMPHVTEEIYISIFSEESVHKKGNWPNYDDKLINKEAGAEGENLVIILDLVRKAKSAQNFSMKKPISKLFVRSNVKLSEEILLDLKNVTNSMEITIEADAENYEQIIKDDSGNEIGVSY